MEALTQFYGQFASVSAVLGGLAFAAAAAILNAAAGTSDPNALNRPAKVTVAGAVASTMCLVFASLLWSVLSAITAISPDIRSALPGSTQMAINLAFLGLCAGTVFLFVSIGASGWIASRRLGILTSAGAAVVGLGALLVLGWVAQF